MARRISARSSPSMRARIPTPARDHAARGLGLAQRPQCEQGLHRLGHQRHQRRRYHHAGSFQREPGRAARLVRCTAHLLLDETPYPDAETFPDNTGNVGLQLDTHPQLVINSNESRPGHCRLGRLSVTGEGHGDTTLDSNTVTPGDSYSSSPTTTTTGPIASPIITTDPRGNWATAVYGASGPNTVDPTDVVANQDVINGGTTNDIVVSNETSGPGDRDRRLAECWDRNFPRHRDAFTQYER